MLFLTRLSKTVLLWPREYVFLTWKIQTSAKWRQWYDAHKKQVGWYIPIFHFASCSCNSCAPSQFNPPDLSWQQQRKRHTHRLWHHLVLKRNRPEQFPAIHIPGSNTNSYIVCINKVPSSPAQSPQWLGWCCCMNTLEMFSFWGQLVVEKHAHPANTILVSL